MKTLAYKIVKLKELQALREKATKAPERVVTARFISEPTSEPTPSETPVGNGKDPMPKSLEGISGMNIELMAIDGNLTGPEQDWFNIRKGRPIDFSHYGKNAWLAF